MTNDGVIQQLSLQLGSLTDAQLQHIADMVEYEIICRMAEWHGKVDHDAGSDDYTGWFTREAA